MAFGLREQARLLLVRVSADRRSDAAGFTCCCGLASCSAPLRIHPRDHARGPHYRGPWRLPGPDFHRLAAVSLSSGYVTTTSLSSWRPDCWTHPPTAGSGIRASQEPIQDHRTWPGALDHRNPAHSDTLHDPFTGTILDVAFGHESGRRVIGETTLQRCSGTSVASPVPTRGERTSSRSR